MLMVLGVIVYIWYRIIYFVGTDVQYNIILYMYLIDITTYLIVVV